MASFCKGDEYNTRVSPQTQNETIPLGLVADDFLSPKIKKNYLRTNSLDTTRRSD